MRRQPIIFIIIVFLGEGVSKLTINGPLIFSLFLPLIKISHEKRFNGQINGVNNGVNNDNFERPYLMELKKKKIGSSQLQAMT